jgi:Cdc6-like AAA superfamily ATPase
MNSAGLVHLNTAVRAQALLPDDDRIRAMQRDRWVDYPRAAEARQRLERLLGTPQRERMPCMIIHGESNIGKTLVVRKFQREHPTSFDDERGVERRQIVAMQMPATPEQHRFYSALLFELGAPHNTSAGLSTLERLARDLLRRIAPRMLVVDEVHHLLAGSYREQRASLNLLKYLANDIRLSIVLVGTHDAPIALQTDSQMSSRFTPFEIPRWRENDEFRRFLAAFGKLLPLRNASELAERGIVQFVLAASCGLTGEVVRILNEAAELAIRDGTESVTLEHLEHVTKAPA